MTLDPYTGRRGPQIVARAATAYSDRALESLTALEEACRQAARPSAPRLN